MDANNKLASEDSAQNSLHQRTDLLQEFGCCSFLRYGATVLALLAALSLAGCYGAPLSTREESTLLGGASGVGAGALIGSAYGAPGTGAALGGIAGAGAGYLIGNHLQNEQYRRGWWGGRGDWRQGRWERGRWGGDDDD